ncbi:MAG: methyltransferase domain-containing protein [Gammaproteobacteria bacterium]|nr:MAG: methyltransferase domain-containing protein [Gammaproteobacteria bacterium]
MKLQEWLQAATDYFDLRNAVLPLADSQQDLDAWFQTRYGQCLVQREQQALEQLMPELGAHRMLYLGAGSCRMLPGNYNHLHSFCLSASPYGTGSAGAIADFDALPLPSETVDTVLLHHALEFSEYPHEVLSEVARVLTPCGHAVIVVFNPISLFGLAKWPVRLFSKQLVWRQHSLRYRRLLDWLRFLNLQPEKAVSGCYTWPLSCGGSDREPGIVERAGQRMRLSSGAFYIVRAKKYTTRLTPLRPSLWRSISAPLLPGLKEPAMRKTTRQERGE